MDNFVVTERSSQLTPSSVTAGAKKFRRGAAPKARHAFLYSKPWQYAGKRDGRKHRVIRERLMRLSRALASLGRSGLIWASVATIVRKLNNTEKNYPERHRFRWSPRSVFRYLKMLGDSGLLRSEGLSKNGTRNRCLNPARLLTSPRESGTPTSRKCGTQKSLKTKKVHGIQNHPPQNSCLATILNPTQQTKPTTKPVAYEQRDSSFVAAALANLLLMTGMETTSLMARIGNVIARATKAGTCIGSFKYLVAGVLRSIEQDKRKKSARIPWLDTNGELIR